MHWSRALEKSESSTSRSLDVPAMGGSPAAIDVSAAIRLAESDLRWLIKSVLSTRHGSDWLDHLGLSPGRIESAEASRAVSLGKSAFESPSEFLEHTQIWDLETVVLRNWEDFKPVFETKRDFEFFMKRLASYRNPSAHSRELLPFQTNLVLGISGEIRNRVTVYRSTMAPDGNYYPRIERITESLGRVWTPREGDGLHHMSGVPPFPRLEVGQEIEFSCHAWDPQGRELTWSLTRAGLGGPKELSATGTSAKLKLTIREFDVGESCAVTISMKSSGKYHRNIDGSDDWVIFRYVVIPPE